MENDGDGEGTSLKRFFLLALLNKNFPRFISY